MGDCTKYGPLVCKMYRQPLLAAAQAGRTTHQAACCRWLLPGPGLGRRARAAALHRSLLGSDTLTGRVLVDIRPPPPAPRGPCGGSRQWLFWGWLLGQRRFVLGVRGCMCRDVVDRPGLLPRGSCSSTLHERQLASVVSLMLRGIFSTSPPARPPRTWALDRRRRIRGLASPRHVAEWRAGWDGRRWASSRRGRHLGTQGRSMRRWLRILVLCNGRVCARQGCVFTLMVRVSRRPGGTRRAYNRRCLRPRVDRRAP